MSEFFPEAQTIRVNPNVELAAFHCGDAVFQLAHLVPGAIFELHHHPESQMGMVIEGRLEMNINGAKAILDPLQQVYLADAHVPHGSINPFAEPALAFDLKKSLPSSCLKPDDAIFGLASIADQPPGFFSHSACANWFEVNITHIAPAAQVPRQRSPNEQMGLVLHGSLVVRVAQEQRSLPPQAVYYVPPNTLYEAYNASTKTITLIKILLSPSAGLAA